MSEKLNNLRKSAQAANAQHPVQRSSNEPFIPGIISEEPKGVIPTPKERIIIGGDGKPIIRREADLSQLPPEEDPNKDEPKSLQEEILKPGGIFTKYLEKKTKEAQEYLAGRIFKDDEIEQTPDGDDITAEENSYEMDEEEAELENAYGGEQETSIPYERRTIEISQEEDMTENENREVKEDLVELGSMTDEEKQDTVDDMKEATSESEEEPPKPKKIIPAGEILEDNYEYPEDVELPNDEEMGKKIANTKETSVIIGDCIRSSDAARTGIHLEISAFSEEEDDMEDLLENDEEEDQEALLTDLRAQITEKIRPVTSKRNISGFTIVKNTKVNMAVPKATGRSAAKWVLPNTGIIIEMAEFGGSEIDYLRDNNNWRVVTQVRNALKMIYDHVVSPKPQKFDSWLKSIAFSDQDDLFMCAYIAGFAGSNYVPYTCQNDKCKYMYLSENLPIMDLVKFNKGGKKKFDALYNSNRTNSGGLYVTEAVPISDQYAVGMAVPSLYDVYIEGGSYSTGFREKYKRNIGLIPYIDAIYKIDWNGNGLIPQNYQVFENNPTKTAKSKAIFYSKILDTLSTDEYSTVYAMVNAIDERSSWYTFQIPEASCPKCKGKIEAEAATARDIFFTRHRLGLLANTSIK